MSMNENLNTDTAEPDDRSALSAFGAGGQVFFDRFVVPLPVEPLDLSEYHSAVSTPGLAFSATMKSITAAASLPFTLARASALNGVSSSIANRLAWEMAIVTPPKTDDDHAKIAEFNLKTEQELQAFVNSQEGHDHLTQTAVDFLANIIKVEEAEVAAAELIFQAATASWTAFEVLARDLIIGYLNARPAEAARIAGLEQMKKRLETKFSIEELSERGFDLRAGMGTLLLGQKDFSDYLTLKLFCDAIFQPCSALNQEPFNQRLLLLNRQRNLIVHRRGIVDQKYLELTKSSETLGTRIAISPVDLLQYFLAVQFGALGLMMAFQKALDAT